MTRSFTSLLLLAVLTSVMMPKAFAADEALGRPYLQKPLGYHVDYRVDAKYLTLRVVADPAIMACGQITDLPMKASFDGEAADIVVGDYMFLQPMGTGRKNCGGAYKAASAEISIDRAALERKNVTQVRFWYQYMLDTFLLLPDNQRGLRLQAPSKPRIFRLGNDMAAVKRAAPKPQGENPFEAAAQAQKPVFSLSSPPPPKNPFVMGDGLVLTTGNVQVDQNAADAIRNLAATRGLVAAKENHIYTDAGGQFALQLRHLDQMTIGAVMVNGTRYPVIARLAK